MGPEARDVRHDTVIIFHEMSNQRFEFCRCWSINAALIDC